MPTDVGQIGRGEEYVNNTIPILRYRYIGA